MFISGRSFHPRPGAYLIVELVKVSGIVANIRLRWKGLPGITTLAYYQLSQWLQGFFILSFPQLRVKTCFCQSTLLCPMIINYSCKSFYTIIPRIQNQNIILFKPAWVESTLFQPTIINYRCKRYNTTFPRTENQNIYLFELASF